MNAMISLSKKAWPLILLSIQIWSYQTYPTQTKDDQSNIQTKALEQAKPSLNAKKKKSNAPIICAVIGGTTSLVLLCALSASSASNENHNRSREERYDTLKSQYDTLKSQNDTLKNLCSILNRVLDSDASTSENSPDPKVNLSIFQDVDITQIPASDLRRIERYATVSTELEQLEKALEQYKKTQPTADNEVCKVIQDSIEQKKYLKRSEKDEFLKAKASAMMQAIGRYESHDQIDSRYETLLKVALESKSPVDLT
jgi:methylthioribose-1-phosphate isomerase